MKKILYTFLAIALSYAGVPRISLAQSGSPANAAGQQEDIGQNMNDMIELLEKLQDEEESSKELLLPKNATVKPSAPAPMAILEKPEENLQPTADLVEKNTAENIFETVNEAIPSDPVAPVSPSQPGDKLSADKTAQPDEIEKNVNEMLKALEELQNNGIENTGDPTKNKTAGKSIEQTDELVRLDSVGPDGHFQNGLKYWKSKDLEAAILEFQEVVRLAPVNAHAYWNLGLIYDESNQGSEAIANIKKAQDIYSKYNYPEFVEDARKRLKSFSEKYGHPLP